MSTPLDNVKILLEIDAINTTKDALLDLYITKAKESVKTICNIKDDLEITTGLNSVIEDIAVWKYRNRGKENKKAETIGSKSASFVDGLPSDILDQIKPYRRIRFI